MTKAQRQQTAEEKAAIRREKVRLNVKAHRERQKQKQKQGLSHADYPKTLALRWIPEKKWEAFGNRNKLKVYNVEDDLGHEKENIDPARMTRLDLLCEPNPEKQYTTALIGMFRSKFLPSQVTLPSSACAMERMATPCASWVIRAFDMAFYKEKSAIGDMLRSISLGLIAIENQREDMRMKSLHSYRTSLTEVRRHVLHLGKSELVSSDFLALVLSCHVAAMYELAVNASLVDMTRHITGIGALILHQLSSNNNISEAFYNMIEEFRMMEMCFCLTFRRKSVLEGIRDRTIVVGPCESLFAVDKSSCYMAGLIDIADRMCSTMVMLDDLKDSITTKRQVRSLLEVIASSAGILDDLEQWSENFLAIHGPSIKNLDTTSLSANLEFVSLSVASTWAYSLAYKLYTFDNHIAALMVLERVDPGLMDRQSVSGRVNLYQAQVEMLGTARLLLRSIPWLHQSDVGITGRTLAIMPLESVRRALNSEIWHCSASAKINTDREEGAPMIVRRELAMYENLALNAKARGLPIISEQFG